MDSKERLEAIKAEFDSLNLSKEQKDYLIAMIEGYGIQTSIEQITTSHDYTNKVVNKVLDTYYNDIVE